MGFVKKNNASFLLFINAVLWGSSYVWYKMLLSYLPRFSILFLCSLGGLISIALIFRTSIKQINQNIILPSIITSSFSILSNAFCMLALQYTGSSNTAFIVQTTVIFTPLIMSLYERKLPGRKIIFSALTALIGLFLLTFKFDEFNLDFGILLALGNAIFFSLFLSCQKINSQKIDPVQFTFIHYITNTIAFSVIAFFIELPSIKVDKLFSPIFAVLIAVSMFITVATVLIQSTAIKFVRPEKATLLYTLEPVTTLIIGFIIIGEKLNGIHAAIGCILIIISVLWSVYKPKVTEEKTLSMDEIKHFRSSLKFIKKYSILHQTFFNKQILRPGKVSRCILLALSKEIRR